MPPSPATLAPVLPPALRPPTRTLALALVLVLVLPLRTAHAQSSSVCDLSRSASSDEVSVRPADGAERVARDAPIIARYAEGTDLDALQASVDADLDAGCRGLAICVFASRSTGTRMTRIPVTGRVQRLDAHTLAFQSAEPLAADTVHFALVARPGFDSASRTELEFETGSALDRDPPELDATPESFELAVEPPPAACEAPEGSLRVRVAVPHVRDDGDEQSVELLLYLTRAPGLAAPELRARADNRAEGSVPLTFTLEPEAAADTVCVAVRAVDGSGKLAEDEPELCFAPDAARRSQFAGLCALGVAHAGADNGRGLLLASAFAVVALGRRRARRARARQR